jgi:chitinase
MTSNDSRARSIVIALLAAALAACSGDPGASLDGDAGVAPGDDAGTTDSATAADAGTSDASNAGDASNTGDASHTGDANTGHDAGHTDSGPPMGAGNFPARFAAPYVETWNDNDLAALANATGHKFYTLAFVINGTSACDPMWNGDTALTGNSYGRYITALRNIGGDVIVSFGGASGTEIGQSCTSVSALQAAYEKVISQFQLTWIDLDIESGAENDTTSIDRRNKALRALQASHPDLRVSYTLGVDRTGLPTAQLDLLKNAVTNGTRVDVVNIMAMDYGPCYSDMGQAAIDAASATQGQLASIGLAAKVGVTPMAGKNDVMCEDFTVANAGQLETFAQANGYVRLLAYWAIGADPGHTYLSAFHPFH